MVSIVRTAVAAGIIVWAAVAAAGETVLLDFSATWCGPCRSMEPVVARLMAAGHPVRKVDVDREPALASRFGVTSIPCFVMIADGRQVDRVVGVASYERLERMFARPPAHNSVPAALASDAPQATARQAAGDASAPRPAKARPTSHQIPADVQASARAATVRICVDDGSGQSFGTGTIVDAREGEALILTCGHLFRDAQQAGQIQAGQITVDLFEGASARKLPGRLIRYDLERDLGLISIRPGGPVTVARIAPKDRQIASGAPVCNVGCNHGDAPTVRLSHITSVDRYQGPPNIEVAEAPVEGRSGGGLFDAEGRVIGVCFAADPNENEGLYAGLPSIHAELEQLGLSGIEAGRSGGPTRLAAAAPTTPPNNGAPSAGMSSPPAAVPTSVRPVASTTPAGHPAGAGKTLSLSEQAALAEIGRRPEGTEVICIIRPADPNEKSEILVLRNVSAPFIERISKAGRRPAPQLTSMERSRR